MARGTRPAPLQQHLEALGAKRVEAALLSHLLDAGACTTEDIIESTGLRQPEVSVGMRSLRERDWVQATPIPREGKGRPMHKYQLSVDRKTLRDHYVESGIGRIKAFEQAIEHLNQLV